MKFNFSILAVALGLLSQSVALARISHDLAIVVAARSEQ